MKIVKSCYTFVSWVSIDTKFLLILSCSRPLFIFICAFGNRKKKQPSYTALVLDNLMPYSMFWDCGRGSRTLSTNVCLSLICY